MRTRKPLGRLALKSGRRFEVIGKEVSSCLPFTYVFCVLKKKRIMNVAY